MPFNASLHGILCYVVAALNGEFLTLRSRLAFIYYIGGCRFVDGDDGDDDGDGDNDGDGRSFGAQ